MSSRIGRTMAVLAAAFIMVIAPGCACTRVEPGYVGIRVNLLGDQRGVEDFPVETGRVWYNPWTEDIYEFPTFMQNAVWSAHGDDGDESISFNSSEGAVVNADVAVSYSIEADNVSTIFVELRKDADYITKVYMRSKVRDAISRHASTMKVTDIFGVKKQELLTTVRNDLQEELGPKGFKFDMLSFVGGLRVDNNVMQSINATISATQKAIEAQNKVLQSKAEADQKIEEARGQAESILLVAKASAEANTTLTASLNEKLLHYEFLQKWNGRLPTVMAGGDNGFVPFLNITPEESSLPKPRPVEE